LRISTPAAVFDLPQLRKQAASRHELAGHGAKGGKSGIF
jgi:hypothetical protein